MIEYEPDDGLVAEQLQVVDSVVEADHLLVVDLSNLAHRAAHAYGTLTRPDGSASGHVFGSIRLMISTLRNELWPGKWCMAYCYDGRGATADRQKILASYKANRVYDASKPNPVVDVKKITIGLPGLHIEAPGREGDDAIAAVVDRAAVPTVLLTADRDLQGLLTYPHVQVLSPTLQRFVGPEDYKKAYLVSDPAKIYLAKALFGDKSDGINGVFRLLKKHVEPILNAPGILTAEQFYGALETADVPATTRAKLLEARDQVLTNFKVIRPNLTGFDSGTIKRVRTSDQAREEFNKLMVEWACHSIPAQAGILFGESTYVKDRR